MTNQNEAVEAVTKKARRAPLKVQKTGAAIVSEIETAKLNVAELEKALEGLEKDGAAYAIVKQAYDAAHKALHDALNKIHFS